MDILFVIDRIELKYFEFNNLVTNFWMIRELLFEKKIRFCEGIIHEDNCFTFQVLLSAKRAFCVNDIYFYRRVREISVMTQKETYKNLRGYFVCLVRQLQFAGEQQIDDPYINQKIEYILWMLNYHVQRIYLKIKRY